MPEIYRCKNRPVKWVDKDGEDIARPFIMSPGGRFREGLDGGLIVPLHLDASEATRFLRTWALEGVTYAVMPIRERDDEDQKERPTAKSPAQRLHASGLVRMPAFWEWLEVDSEDAAHEAVKARYGLEHLRDMTEEQYAEMEREFLAWKRRYGK
jgi:hypothetical protein